MRRIDRSSAFRRDYKRVQRGTRNLDSLLRPVLEALVTDAPLPARARDHALTGNWASYRDCHIRPDLILIYRKGEDTLELVRLGSHSDLF